MHVGGVPGCGKNAAVSGAGGTIGAAVVKNLRLGDGMKYKPSAGVRLDTTAELIGRREVGSLGRDDRPAPFYTRANAETVSEVRGPPRWDDLDSAREASMHYQIRVLRMFLHVFADCRTDNVYFEAVLTGVLESRFR